MGSEERNCKQCVNFKPRKQARKKGGRHVSCRAEEGPIKREGKERLPYDAEKHEWFKAMLGIFSWLGYRDDWDDEKFYAQYCPFYLTQADVRSAEKATA